MKRRNKRTTEHLIGLTICLIVAVIVIALNILIIKSIINADIPIWLKFFLLK